MEVSTGTSANAGGASDAEDPTPGVERLLALSDGVVAIALTLLVLQLVVPPIAGVSRADSRSWHYLWKQLSTTGGDQFTAYIVSFYVIAQFWLTHHRVFRSIEGHVEGLAWWNFGFLFTITLMPFTSDLLGRFGQNPLAIDIFAFNLVLATAATQGVRLFAQSHHLQSADVTERDVRMGYFRSTWLLVVVCLAATVAWYDTGLALYCWLLLIPANHLAKAFVNRFPGRSGSDDQPAAPAVNKEIG